MYMDYSKLWKLLIDRDMSKTDLLALTGISSRVLAKLSKNETVTTDTLARICAALQCNIGDIMDCVSEQQLSPYAAYRKLGVHEVLSEQVETVRFAIGERKFVVYATRQAATKATHIVCGEDGVVYRKQLYAVGIACVPEQVALVKPPRTQEETVIVLIKGKPGILMGLDENGFVSSRGTKKKPTDVYVMSEAAFKLFEVSEK